MLLLVLLGVFSLLLEEFVRGLGVLKALVEVPGSLEEECDNLAFFVALASLLLVADEEAAEDCAPCASRFDDLSLET